MFNPERLIEQQNYFVIHAPRQTGKSKALMAMAEQLTKQGTFLAALGSAEVGAPFSTETGKATNSGGARNLDDCITLSIGGFYELAFELTQGQPWLVNPLAKEVVEEQVLDRSVSITASHIQIAKEVLIRQRDTHLDSLSEKLLETRVRWVLEPMIGGQETGITLNDDRQYLIDLGLLCRSPLGGLVVSNQIYREISSRILVGW